MPQGKRKKNPHFKPSRKDTGGAQLWHSPGYSEWGPEARKVTAVPGVTVTEAQLREKSGTNGEEADQQCLAQPCVGTKSAVGLQCSSELGG